MDGSKKRRVAGAAAFSATAIASLLGAQPAGAAAPAQPPGIAQACQSRPGPDSPDTLAFKQGFPIKWQGLRCNVADEGTVYDWWQKIDR
jgi:hypothetical protein